MAYDPLLADRFRAAIAGATGTVSEKRMMGGICFFLNGHMLGGVNREKTGEGRFMFRVGKANQDAAARLNGGVPVVQGSRRMSGFYFVAEEVCTGAVLADWVALALAHAAALPPKP